MRTHSHFRSSILAAMLIAAGLSIPAFAQVEAPAPKAAATTAEAGETPPAIPAEQSPAARAEYEANMRTLHEQIADKQWQKALDTIALMQQARPREPQARFLKTVAQAELGNEAAAREGLLSLVADFPELPEPHNNLAAIYAREGNYVLAQRELELALTAVPDYAIGHANLADLYLQQAAQQYQRAAALTSNVRERRALQAQADAAQALLAPVAKTGSKENALKENAPKKDGSTATGDSQSQAQEGKSPAGEVTKDGAKDAAKDAAAPKDGGDFLSGSCDAPPGFGGDGAKDNDSPFGGTCEINFDEPAPDTEKR